MPELEYIPSGSGLTAERWNSLYEEFDRKLTLLLDGKSPFILWNYANAGEALTAGSIASAMGRVNYPILGNRFCVLRDDPNYVPVDAENYDHLSFATAEGSVAEISRDETNKTMRVTDPDGVDFTDSLQAHKRGDFYLWPQSAPVPEKHYKYAVAEIIYDWDAENLFPGDPNPPAQEVVFPAIYDKYNFFRLHNLTALPVRVLFEGAEPGYFLTVPAYGCKAFRRDAVVGPYTTCFNYFFKFQHGDPRIMRPLYADEQPMGRVYGSMQGNNVVNPLAIFHWIETFAQNPGAVENERGLAGIIWYSDRHGFLALGDYHGLYGDPANGATIIGDLIHHKGHLRYQRTGQIAKTADFQGYATIYDDFAAAGLTISDDGVNLSISAPIGAAENLLISYGTNLLCGGDATTFTPAGTADCGSPLAIDKRWPDADFSAVPIYGASSTVTYDFLDDALATVTASYDKTTLTQASLIDARPQIKIWQNIVTDLLTLNSFGSADYASTNQETEFCEFQNRRVILTVFGPKILFERVIYLTASDLGGIDLFEDRLATIEERDGVVSIRSKHAIDWTPCGWGTENNPAFLTPRKKRRYSTLADGGKHPNITGDISRPDGKDFDTSSIGRSYIPSEIAALAPISPTVATGSAFAVWTDPDGLNAAMGGSGDMPRIYTLSEVFNSLVAAVISLRRGTPLNFRHSHLYFEPNETGVGLNTGLPSCLVPIDQYAAGEFDGVTGFNAGVYDSQFRFPDPRTPPVAAWSDFGNEPSALLALPYDGTPSTFEPLDHPYVSVEQVRSYADSHGFKFIWRKTGIPLSYQRLIPSVDFNYVFPCWSSEITDPAPMWRRGPSPFPSWRPNQSYPTILKSGSLAADDITVGFPGDALTYLALNDAIARDASPPNSLAYVVWADKRMIYQHRCSEGLGGREKVILIQAPHFRHTVSDYSAGDIDAQNRKYTYSFAVLPVEGVTEEGLSESVSVELDDDTFVEAAHDASYVLIYEPPVLDLEAA